MRQIGRVAILASLLASVAIDCYEGVRRRENAGTKHRMKIAATSGQECGTPIWGEASELIGSAGRPPYLFRHPSIAEGRGVVYLVGNDVPTLLQPVKLLGPLAIWSFNSGRIEPPAGPFAFVNPQAFVDSRGKLQVLWGEPREPNVINGPVFWRAIQVGAIWTASYDVELGWSPPRQLYADSGAILWIAALADRVSIDTAHRAAIAVPVLNPEAPRTVLLVFDGDRWRAVRTPIGGVAASTLIRDDTTIVAYLAAAEGTPRDVNSVFVVRSVDGGESWRAPELVWRSGTRPANSLRMRMTTDGALHLFWAQQDVSGAAVLRHMVQKRDATEWNPLAEMALEGGFNALQVVTDPCGRIHVIFEDYARMGPDGSFTFATWLHSWSKPSKLFGQWRPMDPAMSVTPNGRLVLTMLARLGSDPLHPTYRQLWAEAP